MAFLKFNRMSHVLIAWASAALFMALTRNSPADALVPMLAYSQSDDFSEFSLPGTIVTPWKHVPAGGQ